MRKLYIPAICILPSMAYANVVWPALILETRIFSWWAIGAGLLIELFFVKCLFDFTLRKTAIAVLSANTASTTAGLLLIPLAGIIWEIFPGSIVNLAFSWGTFNPITWAATFILGCLANGFVEGAVYKKWFAPSFSFKSKAFLWLLAANSISVGTAAISLWLKPAQL